MKLPRFGRHLVDLLTVSILLAPSLVVTELGVQHVGQPIAISPILVLASLLGAASTR